jgi:hypothetical protein
MPTLKHAFKEWAVICEALKRGQQSIILRKGGISEEAGQFDLAHSRFWLLPTYTHQQGDGVRTEAHPLLDEVEAARPPSGTLRLQTWAEVTGVYQVSDLLLAQMLAHLHLWSDRTVDQRFAYRSPGINVLAVRVYQAPEIHELPDRTDYQVCRSWVELEHALPTDGSVPVLGDAAYRDVQFNLDLLLRPTAHA